jgi:hypothetical protein
MFAHFELPDKFYENDSYLRDTLAALAIDFEGPGVTLKPNIKTNSEVVPADSLCRVVDGIIKVYGNDRLLYFFETGDAFLSTSLHSAACQLFSEFPSVIETIPLDKIQENRADDKEFFTTFSRFQQVLSAQFHIFLQATSPPEIDVQPETRTFSPGDVIIIQETSPNQVFTLLSGEADVFMGEKNVGEVLVGEIFGAMAVTGNIPRSASVIARTHCVALSLPKENFLALARTHPETLFKLIDTMSRIIMDLNEKLRGSSS